MKFRYWLLVGFLAVATVGYWRSYGERIDRLQFGLGVGSALFIVAAVVVPSLIMALCQIALSIIRDVPSGRWREWRPLSVAFSAALCVVLPVALAVFVPERTLYWTEADNYVGDDRKVCGPVISVRATTTEDGRDLTFVNVGTSYPDRSGVTFAVNGPSFQKSDMPADDVCAEGAIREHEGRSQIFVSSAARLMFPSLSSADPEDVDCYDFKTCY